MSTKTQQEVRAVTQGSTTPYSNFGESTLITISEQGKEIAIKKLCISAGEIFAVFRCECSDGKTRSFGAFRQEY